MGHLVCTVNSLFLTFHLCIVSCNSIRVHTMKCYMIVNLWFVFIFFQGDVKVKRFTLNDKEKALKEQFLKR